MAGKILPHNHSDISDLEHVSRHLSRTNDFETVAELFSQLGDPSRLRLFWMLCHCEECVTDIAEMMDMTSPAVSHHLRVLKNCGLIDSRRDGKEVYYKASSGTKARLMHNMIEQVMEIICPTDLESVEPSAGVTIDSHKEDISDTIRRVHDYTLEHLSERITIEELSHMFLLNPTTLKEEFKALYGESIAAHTKEHRMELAATLLTTTRLSLAEIAGQVGYESQSKFTENFKGFYNMLPSEYRRTNTSKEKNNAIPD